MARNQAAAVLTRGHRSRQLALRAATLRDLTALWPLWRGDRIETFPRFTDAAATLTRSRYATSAGLASEYYQAFRLAERISGEATPRIPQRPPVSEIQAALRATGLRGTLRAVRAGFSLQAARQQGFTAVAGSVGRMVLNGARDTIVQSSATDRQALGWARVTDADPCHFCAMIASRGPVFSERTADFQAHDHCACVAEPHYEGAQWPGRAREWRELWDRTTSGLSGREAQREFRRVIEGRT